MVELVITGDFESSVPSSSLGALANKKFRGSMYKPKSGFKMVHLEMIHSKLLLIHTKKGLDSFIQLNELEDYPLADDWDRVDGSVSLLKKDEKFYYVMLIKDKSLRTIVHEAVHAAHFILSGKGIPIEEENTEIIAYTADYLTDQICKALKI